jgi:uncharacterized caspase-like protein
MNKHLKICLWGLAIWVLTMGASLAAPRVALVIGNAAYTGEKPLRNPLNDAVDVSAALRAQGYVVQQHTNLGRLDMNRAIERFLSSAEGAELALVYYSGHGMQSAGETFFIPTDARIQSERDVRSEGVRMNELMDDLESRRIRKTVLIVDACRDNPYATRSRSTSRGLGRPKEMNGAFLVAYATADGQTADDGEGRNGTYTGQLLQQLRSQAASRNLRDLLEDTQLAVERASNGQQRPKLYGDTAKFRDVYLASVVPEAVRVPVARPDSAVQAAEAAAQSARDATAAAAAASNMAAQASTQQLLEGRYQILGDGSEVKDIQTGLIWQRCSVGQRWTGQTCEGGAGEFKFDEAQKLTGNGWRVPTVRELHSLVWCSSGKTKNLDDPEDGKGAIANYCDGNSSRPTIRSAAFTMTSAVWYWSSSPDVSNADYARVVDFGFGHLYIRKRSDTLAVRLVQASQ